MEEPNYHHETERAEDILHILYRRHFQGALVRSGASMIMWMFALAAYLADVIKMNHFKGISLSVLYLILINPPTLLLLKRITNLRLYGYASILINFLEILGYTAIIYSLGGIEATFLTPIYAALITYVGVMGPRAYNYFIAFLCSAAFSFVVGCEYFGLIPRQTVVPSFNPSSLTILSYLSVVIGLLFVVAYVSSLTSGILKKNRDKLREQNFKLKEKAAALKQAEKNLQTAHHELERLVEERTAELGQANDRLRREIGERKQAEGALRENENRLRAIVEGTQALLANVDTNGYFTYANDATARAVGYAASEELIGKSYLHFIHPEDRQQVRDAFINQVSTRQSSTLQEFRITDTQGNVKWFSFLSTLTIKDGQFVGQSGVAQDITERKQAEEALRESNSLLSLFMKHSPIYTFIKDVTPTESRVLMASENYQDMIGVPGSEMVGRTMEELFPEEFAAKITADDWAVVSCGKAIKLDEDLNGRNYTTFKFPIFHKGKNRLAGYTIDITDHKRAEEQVRQLKKVESLSRMAGAIAHHFNNQLQVLTGHLEMAIIDLPPESGAVENMAQAMRASRSAADEISLMLAYLGQTPGKHERLDLSETCRLGLSMIRTVIPNKVIMEPQFPSPGPTILANANQIQQVLANIVTNAWESMGERPYTIGLTVKTVSPADISTSCRFPVDWQPQEINYACLEVADEGCGIPEIDIEKIFDPFFSTKFTGRGMGLSVVLGIVRAHSGVITVESVLGRGSIFRVFLPVTIEEILSEQEKAAPAPEFKSGGTVLLIEDEEQVRNMARIMLTRLGYAVLEAKDGLDAVEIFQQHQDEIRCVLTDLTMPRMNGWDTLAALRKLSPDIPVILSSGYDEAQVMAGEHLEQPNAFLGKPYRLQELKDTVRLALAGKGKSITHDHSDRTDSSAAKETGECHNDQ